MKIIIKAVTVLGVLVNSIKAIDVHSSVEYTDEAKKDMITNMPGLDYDPGFNQFSGYLNIKGSEKYVFYWYVESQNNPKKDPVAYWTNGGPGCSGLLGFGTEMGPFLFQKNGTVEPNPYSWNKLANMFFFEQPAGVGFSYSDNEDDYKTGDKQAALDQYDAILAFFERFPERKSNDFYITSESYGGHYMPQLALTILELDTEKEINFQGFAVGNAFVDADTNDIAMWQMYYYRGLVGKPVYDGWLSYGCDNPKRAENHTMCILYEDEMILSAGYYGINPYALDYPVCLEDADQSPFGGNLRKTDHLWSHQGARLLGLRSPAMKNYVENYEPCVDDYLDSYLNRHDVQEAIHANHVKWTVCSYKLDWPLQDRQSPQNEYYYKLVHGGYGLKMLVFSGDDDSVCATPGTQDWIWNLGVDPKKHSDWNIWKVEGQIAGYVTEFQLDSKSDSFVFATVHGAGHEVPTYKPMQAFD